MVLSDDYDGIVTSLNPRQCLDRRSLVWHVSNQLLNVFKAFLPQQYLCLETSSKVRNLMPHAHHSPYLGILLLGLTLWSLNLIDSMRLYSMGPVVVSLGLLVSTALLRSRDLMIPLWFGRHIMRWCAIGLLQLVFICFALLQRGFYFDEQRKLVVDL